MPILRYALCFLLSTMAGAARAQDCPYKQLNSDQVNQLTRDSFPSARPGYGKAYTFWRNRSFEPNQVFNYVVGMPRRILEEAVLIGGWLVGYQNKVGPEPFTPLVSGLSDKCSGQLRDFYKQKPTILFTPPEKLAVFEKLLKPAIEKHGSAENLLRAAKVSLELTPEKAAALRAGDSPAANGKFIVAEDGRVFFLNEREMTALRAETGVEDIKHGMIAWLIMQTVHPPLQAAIDYGTTQYKNGTFTFGNHQKDWNKDPSQQFDTLGYLRKYP